MTYSISAQPRDKEFEVSDWYRHYNPVKGKKRSVKLHEEEKTLDRNKAEGLEYLTHGYYYATGEISNQSGQPSEKSIQQSKTLAENDKM